MMSGLAPGKFAETLIVGKSTCGNGAVGSCKKATNPARAIAAVSNAVAIGRRMNGAEMPSSPLVRAGLAPGEGGFMPALPQEGRPCFVPRRASGRTSRPVDQRRDR